MDQEIELHSGTLALDAAILLYRSGSDTIATLHQVKDGVIQIGKPIDLEGWLRDNTARKEGKPVGSATWTHERMLWTRDELVCWWRPAKRTVIYFAKGRPHKCWIPPMVFIANSRNIRVFAIAADKRPTRSTMLYLTGWSNTYNDGGVCIGSGLVPGVADPDKWEDAFFASAFSYHSNFRTSRYVVTKKHKRYNTLDRVTSCPPAV